MKKIFKISGIVVPIALFILLIFFIQTNKLYKFENWIYYESTENMTDIKTIIIKSITHTGDAISVIIICLILFAFSKTRYKIALPLSIAVITSAIFNIILKNIFTRERPNILKLVSETSYSFPSGHAMINITLYTMLILLIWKYIKGKKTKYIMTSACLILTALIGYSRIYLGVHYVTDIIGGWLAGFAVALITYILWFRIIEDKNTSIKFDKAIDKLN